VQDDPQPVAAAHGMLHVPLPGPQQTSPLTNTTQAHVVQQPVPVQSITGEISSFVHLTSSNQDEPLFIPGLTRQAVDHLALQRADAERLCSLLDYFPLVCRRVCSLNST
jgi:hypothetical protein